MVVHLIRDLEELARTNLKKIEALEFQSTEALPEGAADELAAVREALTRIAWILWAVVQASNDPATDPRVLPLFDLGTTPIDQ